MKVFIVFGQTGEYGDHRDWAVRGFLDPAKAEAFEFECTKAAKAFKDRIDAHDSANCDKCFDVSRNFEKCGYDEKPAIDPSFRCDYTGTDYFTIQVEVES